MENIDFERLRKDLISYYGSATVYYGVAYMYLIEVENANYNKLLELALKNGFNLSDYEKYDYTR